MVYSREIDGKILTFGVSGKLLKNALIMFDYETDSLWPIMLNRAVRGEMEGTRLEELPVVWKTTWGKWKAAHPETRVLSVEGREYMPENVYAERFAKGKAGAAPIENIDDRLERLERVLGLSLTGISRAYPLRHLREAGVVQEEIGKVSVIIAAVGSTGAFEAFDRRLGAEVLEFSSALKDGLLVDKGGSLWDPESGIAVEGALEGRRLVPLPARDVYWFVWADYHPDTTIFGEESSSEEGEPPGEKPERPKGKTY